MNTTIAGESENTRRAGRILSPNGCGETSDPTRTFTIATFAASFMSAETTNYRRVMNKFSKNFDVELNDIIALILSLFIGGMIYFLTSL